MSYSAQLKPRREEFFLSDDPSHSELLGELVAARSAYAWALRAGLRETEAALRVERAAKAYAAATGSLQ